jgi:hypothetical protein
MAINGDDTLPILLRRDLDELKEDMREHSSALKAHVNDDLGAGKEMVGLLRQISTQVADTHESFLKLDKKLDLSIQKLEFEVKTIHQVVGGHSDQLQKSETKLEALESPQRSLKLLAKTALFIGGILAGLAALRELLGK